MGVDKTPSPWYNKCTKRKGDKKMKVKCYINVIEERIVDIDDKFAKLDVDCPWEHPELTNEDYEECIRAVEEATGVKMDEYEYPHIEAVECVESGEMILEL
jgi:hypothetical protein